MNPDAIFGGGGIRISIFKAKASGTVKIQMTLRREWEPENSVIDSFEVTIHIRDNH
ncbi:hypothetical protein DENIS_1970 [Desulfonema ishimotonii]|uniref:Proteinase inhibitor I42 chagasin domain-containing protein n=1 Tax=Desulfonema ishimotonii TaxID=45657 RepID=A0A401FVM4_9BACT|nr:hypothetical protein DENIS_1970 [Desulfonema ishimotonii]